MRRKKPSKKRENDPAIRKTVTYMITLKGTRAFDYVIARAFSDDFRPAEVRERIVTHTAFKAICNQKQQKKYQSVSQVCEGVHKIRVYIYQLNDSYSIPIKESFRVAPLLQHRCTFHRKATAPRNVPL